MALDSNNSESTRIVYEHLKIKKEENNSDIVKIYLPIKQITSDEI